MPAKPEFVPDFRRGHIPIADIENVDCAILALEASPYVRRQFDNLSLTLTHANKPPMPATVLAVGLLALRNEAALSAVF
jgi:hypothetical protein